MFSWGKPCTPCISNPTYTFLKMLSMWPNCVTVTRAPPAYCIALTSSIHFSLIQSSADQQSMAQHLVMQHDEAEDESLLSHRWVGWETCPAALSLPCGFDRGWSHHFPSQAFESLFLPGSWITVRHSRSSSLMMGTDKLGRKSNPSKKTKNLLHTSQTSTRLSFAFAQPVFQAPWSVSLPLAQPSVWETFALHTAQPVCAVCVYASMYTQISLHRPFEFLLWQTDL